MNRLHSVSQTVAVQRLDIAVQLINNYYYCMKVNTLSWLRCKVKVAIAVKSPSNHLFFFKVAVFAIEFIRITNN